MTSEWPGLDRSGHREFGTKLAKASCPMAGDERHMTWESAPAALLKEDAPGEEAIAVSSWGEMKNYKSFSDNLKDSTVEMDRLVEKGYVKKLTLQQAEHYFTSPVVSKLRLIVKEKLDGTKKRRVIVDARRSGANHRAVCPERIIVLPRPEDVHGMLRHMKEDEPQLRAWYRTNQEQLSEWSAELVAADLTDASRTSLSQRSSSSSAGDGLHLYVLVALFFGHKSAPLLMCRLAAMLSRLL